MKLARILLVLVLAVAIAHSLADPELGKGGQEGGGQERGQSPGQGRGQGGDQRPGGRGESSGDQSPSAGQGRQGERSQSPGRGHGAGRGRGAGQGGGRPDDIHESIKAERERLGRLPTHFVGKHNPRGNRQHPRNKTGKRERPKNPKLIMWNGVAKVVRGIAPDDAVHAAEIPVELATLQRHGRPCLQGKQYRQLQATDVSGGPTEEGFTVNDFKPCLERRRGKKEETPPASPQRDSPTDQEAAFRAESEQTSGAHRRSKRSESYSILAMLWKDPVKGVPYAFDRTFPIQYRQNVRNAIKFWQDRTCLRFLERPTATGITEPFILFTLGSNGCSTNRLGPNTSPPYSTIIDIGTCEELVGSIAHEIGHAMGLAHTQKRVDRDGSVRLYFQNIATSWASQFDRNPAQYFDPWGVPYYYDSIMHYFPYSASRNGLMTICPLDPIMELVMGQREEPAFGDVSLMNRIYCQESCFPRAQLKGMQFFGNKSMTISGRTCQNWSSQSPVRHRFTTVGNHSSCRNPDRWDAGPWCYTTDPAVRFEPCFSPCEDLAANNRSRCQGWCFNGGYHDPRTCACVCPKHATGPACETVNRQALYSNLECGGKMELRPGQRLNISSPNYPSNYPLNKACVWWLQAPNNTRVKITIQDFDMEDPDPTGCYDYLEIRPSICAPAIEPVEQMRFCGDSLAPQTVLHSDDNNMVLKFFSDEAEQAKGFRLIAELASTTSG